MRKIEARLASEEEVDENDVVHPGLFNLERDKIQLVVTPTSETKFWRIGFAFSSARNFRFDPKSGRYENSSLRFIEIDIGTRDPSKSWSSPETIAISSYHIPEFEKNPKVVVGYLPGSEVLIRLKSEPQGKIVVHYSTSNFTDTRTFSLDNYKYYRIFGWADGIKFDLDCKIEITKEPGYIFSDESAVPNAWSITDNFNPVLGVKVLGEEVASVISDLKDDKGNMLGIFGKWGRGKTFLWKEIWNALKQRNNKRLVKFYKSEFHAWKYQDTPASWAYLYEVFALAYFQDKSSVLIDTMPSTKKNLFMRLWHRVSAAITKYIRPFLRRVDLNISRNGWRGIFIFLLSVLITSIWVYTKKIFIFKQLIAAIGLVMAVKTLYLYYHFTPKAISLINKYTSKTTFKQHLGLQAEIQKEIVYLFKTWIKKNRVGKQKIVLFVDDIDRCSEDRIIQVVDALKVMLEDDEISKRLIVVLALDGRVLKMAIEHKYHNLLKNVITTPKAAADNDIKMTIDWSVEKFVKEYIDKLFLAGIKLGELNLDEKTKILETITEGKIQQIEKEQSIQSTEDTLLSEQGSFYLPLFSSISDIVEFNDLGESTTQESEISPAEYRILQNILLKSKLDTPRSIRIFYYRYILAKRILNAKLRTDTEFFREWTSSYVPAHVMPSLISFFTTEAGEGAIEKDLKAFDESSPTEMVKVSQGNIGSELTPYAYHHMLKLVQMVTTYV